MKRITDETMFLRKSAAILVSLALVSCGGSSGDGGASLVDSVETAQITEPVETVETVDADADANGTFQPISLPSLEQGNEVPVDAEQADLFDQTESVAIVGEGDAIILPEDTGDLIPVIFPTETSLDLDFAQSGAAMIELLNESLILPRDIDVSFSDCGTANAFFIPPGQIEGASEGGSIVLCHELTELFLNLYADPAQAFNASVFVMMHEVGHALVDQLELPVLGIEEPYVDGIGAVLVAEAGLAEASVLAGWFFFSQPATPFFDTHRAGSQRLGDLACWGVGADPSLLEDPTINGIAEQLIAAGRNCTFEYNQQLEGFNAVLGDNFRGKE